MKAYLNIILLLAVSLSGCKISKNKVQSKETESSVEINCTDHNKPTSYFSGKVTDINTREAIQAARVVLRSFDRTELYSALTDSEGNFIIKNIPLGNYNVTAEYMGYRTALFDNLAFKNHSICVADIKVFFEPITVEKPVIYLYPIQKQNIQVTLNYKGTLTHTYPKYSEKGWNVTAEPNGTLYDENGQEYYALFWEGNPTEHIIPTDGFVVSGKETVAFLEEKLAYLGLNRREANEFIMYWLPRMENNPYNFIHFAGKQYEAQAEFDITPTPETIIRVMMLTQSLEKKINFPSQDLSTLKKTRKGFTVVEWGGSEMDNLLLYN